MSDGQSTVQNTVTDPQATGHPAEARRFERQSGGESFGEPRGYGWVIFAGVMLMIAGVLNMIYGIAAISNSHFYITNTHYVFSELNTWGWIMTVIGGLQACVALGVWMQATWARWTGSALARRIWMLTR